VQNIYNGKDKNMAYKKYEEAEEIIDWDAIAQQPKWMRKLISEGKKKPLMKKKIRSEKKKEESNG